MEADAWWGLFNDVKRSPGGKEASGFQEVGFVGVSEPGPKNAATRSPKITRGAGQIDVESAPGEGTVFRIRIPKVIEDSEAA